MESAALFAFDSLTGDQVTHIDHIAQFAYFFGCLDAFEEVFGLLIEHVQPLPCATQTYVRTHDADIGGHDLTHFFDVLGDQHAFLDRHGPFVVPCRDLLVEIIVFNHGETVFGSRVGIDDGFNERVGRQPVSTMQTRTRTLAYGIEPADRRLTVQIHLNTAAHVVGTRRYRDVFFRDVNTDREAFGINIREVVLGLLRVLVGHIQTDMVDRVNLHLIINRARNDVARCERQTRVVFLHELLAVRQAQNTSVAAHGLGDQIRRMGLRGVEE